MFLVLFIVLPDSLTEFLETIAAPISLIIIELEDVVLTILFLVE